MRQILISLAGLLGGTLLGQGITHNRTWAVVAGVACISALLSGITCDWLGYRRALSDVKRVLR